MLLNWSARKGVLSILGTIALVTYMATGFAVAFSPKPSYVPPPPSVAASGNWAGYIATGAKFRSVQATYVIPTVNCSVTPNALTADWVGIDGFNDKTVEQIGTSSGCASGHAFYYLWYEMYPADPVPYIGVNPGDTIHLSVTDNDGVFSLTLIDLTLNQTLHVTQKCSSCGDDSAEIIAEAPFDGQIMNLADFGAVSFSDATAVTQTGVRARLNVAMEMVDSNALAIPSVLFGGDSFVVSWEPR